MHAYTDLCSRLAAGVLRQTCMGPPCSSDEHHFPPALLQFCWVAPWVLAPRHLPCHTHPSHAHAAGAANRKQSTPESGWQERPRVQVCAVGVPRRWAGDHCGGHNARRARLNNLWHNAHLHTCRRSSCRSDQHGAHTPAAAPTAAGSSDLRTCRSCQTSPCRRPDNLRARVAWRPVVNMTLSGTCYRWTRSPGHSKST